MVTHTVTLTRPHPTLSPALHFLNRMGAGFSPETLAIWRLSKLSPSTQFALLAHLGSIIGSFHTHDDLQDRLLSAILAWDRLPHDIPDPSPPSPPPQNQSTHEYVLACRAGRSHLVNTWNTWIEAIDVEIRDVSRLLTSHADYILKAWHTPDPIPPDAPDTPSLADEFMDCIAPFPDNPSIIAALKNTAAFSTSGALGLTREHFLNVDDDSMTWVRNIVDDVLAGRLPSDLSLGIIAPIPKDLSRWRSITTPTKPVHT